MHCVLSLVFIISFSLYPTFVYSQASNKTVLATDSQITYTGNGWTSSNKHIFTAEAGSFSLDFTGSAVYWYSRKLWNGAVAIISLDGDTTSMDLSNGMGQNDESVVAVLYSRTGLDASKNHNFKVEWGGPGGNGVGSFLENYQITYTVGTIAISTSRLSPAQPSSTSSSPSSLVVSPSTSQSNTASTSSLRSSPISSLDATTALGLTYVVTSGSTFTLIVTPSGSLSFHPSSTLTSLSNALPPSGTTAAPTSDSAQFHSQSRIPAIIGGVVGGVSGIILFICFLVCLRRRRGNDASQDIQSATPFFSDRNLISRSRKNSLHSPSSVKAPNSPLRRGDQPVQDRVYVLINPAYSATLVSPGTISPPQVASTIETTSPSSLGGFARLWKWSRSESSQANAAPCPQVPSTAVAVGQTYAISQNEQDDPPPRYAR